MDWEALLLSMKLSGCTVLVLLPIGLLTGRWLAYHQFYGKSAVQALLAIPLVLPPTVLGYYLLISLGNATVLGRFMERWLGHTLVFSFEGLVVASILFNLPFAIQPIQRAFEAIPRELREAGACCAMTPAKIFWRIELPLSWPGIVSAIVLTFAHTLGEFGVVLMVGGSIPGETKTIAIAIYDRVQAFDNAAAASMSALLLIISLVTITLSYAVGDYTKRRYG
jgi:molybdate transport system permease protein